MWFSRDRDLLWEQTTKEYVAEATANPPTR